MHNSLIFRRKHFTADLSRLDSSGSMITTQISRQTVFLLWLTRRDRKLTYVCPQSKALE